MSSNQANSPMYRPRSIARAAWFVAAALIFILAHDAYGQAMSSPTYKIQSDSVNFGGSRSSSGVYTMEDTLGESATGVSSSTNYAIKAGYQQMQEVILAVVPASDIIMTPSIPGITGGTSNGSTTFRVTTDGPAGYQVTIVASSSPALASPLDSFADLVPAGAAPDFSFSTVPAGTSAFAFSPEGTDIAQRFKDNGSACNTGSSDATLSCWDGLSTTPATIVSRTSANHPNGVVTTLNFRAIVGTNRGQINGTYTATSTITITAL